jgi:hypothetical protein
MKYCYNCEHHSIPQRSLARNEVQHRSKRSTRLYNPRTLPNLNIALLCVVKADSYTAEKERNAKKMQLIDEFFQCSVTGEFISVALDLL